MVRFEHVSKRFDRQAAVDDLSFEIRPGAITGLIGPNGSGKTTTLRMILGLIHPDSGHIALLGGVPGEAASDRIGYLPEERGLYRRMSVNEVLRYYARLKNARASTETINHWLERFQIKGYGAHKIEALSKGTAQKVQFIATALHEPELLILDEPFSGLDPVSADLLRHTLFDLVAVGTTVLLSTHDMNTAENLCDAVLMLHNGKKVLDGTRQEIRERFGEATIKLVTQGDVTEQFLAGLPGVGHVLNFRGYWELVLQPGAAAQTVLQRLASSVTVKRFEVSTPSLHDIFVRLAGEPT